MAAPVQSTNTEEDGMDLRHAGYADSKLSSTHPESCGPLSSLGQRLRASGGETACRDEQETRGPGPS